MKGEDSLGLGHVEAHAEESPKVVMRRRSSGKTSEVCTILWNTVVYCGLYVLYMHLILHVRSIIAHYS